MLSRYVAVIFLAVIARAATIIPSPREFDLAAYYEIGMKSFTAGHITCVALGPSDGFTLSLSAALNEDGSIRSANGEDFLEALLDLDTATTASVNIKFLPQRPWYQRLFSFQIRYLAATPPSEDCRRMGPSTGTHAWLHGAENRTAFVPDSSLPEGICVLARSGSSGTPYAPTQLWRFEPSTKRLIPRWVNPDGSTPDMHVFYKKNGEGMAFGITGNISALPHGYDARECVLVFNPV